MNQTLEQRASLEPRYDTLLNDEQEHWLRKLDQFEAPYLEEKLLQEGFSKEEYQEAFAEFKKYAVLAGMYGEKLAMTSEKVDAVWHQFILFTKEYHQFCRDFFGRYLHHTPKTSYTPLAKEGRHNFMRLYEATFGEIPEIWRTSLASADPCDLDSCTNSGDDDDD